MARRRSGRSGDDAASRAIRRSSRRGPRRVVFAGAASPTPSARASSAATANDVIIFSKVQRRSLQDTVALSGTLARKQIRNVTPPHKDCVSAVTRRTAPSPRPVTRCSPSTVAMPSPRQGTVPFFRSLAPGDQGDDVLQLKQILAAAGDYPGPINNLYTEQTQFALAQWQAQHHYPNSTPATPESVTVSLAAGIGLQAGDAGLGRARSSGHHRRRRRRAISGRATGDLASSPRPSCPRTTTTRPHHPIRGRQGSPGHAGHFRHHCVGVTRPARHHGQPDPGRHGRAQDIVTPADRR